MLGNSHLIIRKMIVAKQAKVELQAGKESSYKVCRAGTRSNYHYISNGNTGLQGCSNSELIFLHWFAF